MAQDFSGQREQVRITAANARSIELGWTVLDSLGRPVGNVSDVETDRLRIDGRPEGLGMVNVPLAAVREAGGGEVHLNLRTEDLNENEDSLGAPGMTESSRPVASPTTSAAATNPLPPASTVETTTPRVSRSEALDGSSYSSSATPVGLGSNTPVGAEPSSFQQWDRSVEDTSRSRWPGWLAPTAAAGVGFASYLWWRRKQLRRTPLERAIDTVSGASETAWDSARERPWSWSLAPLALGALAWYLRSDDDGPADTSTDQSERAKDSRGATTWGDAWREYWPNLGRSGSSLGDWVPSADVFERGHDRAVSPWVLAVPAIGAALGAVWYAFGGRSSKASGKKLADIMTRNVQTIRPDATLFEAASAMRRLDVGALPVCDGQKLQGMLTDRDIVLQAVAEGRDPHLTNVQDAMSRDEVVYAFAEDSVDKGAKLMREHQIRRLPVVDQEKNLVGIISLGDLAVDSPDDALTGRTLEQVSEPSRPSR